jgi:hypothetical protein
VGGEKRGQGDERPFRSARVRARREEQHARSPTATHGSAAA